MPAHILRVKTSFISILFSIFVGAVFGQNSLNRVVNGAGSRMGPFGGAIMEVDIKDGSSSVINVPFPGKSLTGADFTQDGRFWVSTNNPSQIAEIDPISGVLLGSPIDVLVNGNIMNVRDLSIQPSTGIIYLLGQISGALFQNCLVKYNPQTSQFTFIGHIPQIRNSFVSIAFHSDGRLFSIQANGVSPLKIIDITNASVMDTVALSEKLGFLGLGFNKEDGLLYGSECCNTVGNLLYSINPETGLTTQIGSFGIDRVVHDIAFFTPPADIPALSTWSVYILGLILIIFSVISIKSNARAPLLRENGDSFF